MCGISGLLNHVETQAAQSLASANVLRAMSSAMAHRGPDAEGFWLDAHDGIGLAHRRLSILDLSEAGAQPMLSVSGRYVVVFNGEIYNHLSLRQDLEVEAAAPVWRGHSDTETLLAAIAHWGLSKTLSRAFGMFAIAIWDKLEKRLSLARDRVGEKPLHVARIPDGWAFSSEIQALYHAPGFAPRVHGGALADYIALQVVPDESCIFEDVRKVRPGHILHFDQGCAAPREERYFDMLGTMDQGRAAVGLSRRSGRSASASVQIESVLRDVVASQMISDVPLGSFLSGGIDSSLVTAIMQELSARPVRTFTIGFGESGYDESAHAERVAEHLGTDHTTYRLTEADALELVPRLPRIYAEPFADSSQIPTALLCMKAREQVTVALTGDGGDEIFGGYNRHVLAPRLWKSLQRVPPFLRKASGPVARSIQGIGGANSTWLRILARKLGIPASALDKAGRLGEIAAQARSLEDVYRGLTRASDVSGRFLCASVQGEPAVAMETDPRLATFTPQEWMMAQDTVGYLPGDILVKVDRAAMAASLETRAPLLDARTIAAAWNLPLDERIRGGKGKQVLREILDRHVPRQIIDRPKQGFAIPLDRWLRGELRAWADELLSDKALGDGGLLEPEPVRQMWIAHLANQGNHGHSLWPILMLQAWTREWFPQGHRRG